jgi:hypothetical protein
MGKTVPLNPSGQCTSLGIGITMTAQASLQTIPATATCGQGSGVVATIPEYTFDEEWRTCQATSPFGKGCKLKTQVCAPKPSDKFSTNGLCVFHTDDVACPGLPYTKKHLVYQDVMDDRRCEPCECKSVGAACNGKLYAFADAECQSSKTEAACGANGVALALMYIEEQTTDGKCAASGGMAAGSAMPSKPITICCK